MEVVLSFLCQADVLVTTSYHGAYWASMMGKKVVALNTAHNSKLLYFPYSIEIVHLDRGRAATAEQLRAAISRARNVPRAVLAQERQRTWNFYERVLRAIRANGRNQREVKKGTRALHGSGLAKVGQFETSIQADEQVFRHVGRSAASAEHEMEHTR